MPANGRDSVNANISPAYATGAVSGGQNVGGLVGYFAGGSVTQSYATGVVSRHVRCRRAARLQRRLGDAVFLGQLHDGSARAELGTGTGRAA